MTPIGATLVRVARNTRDLERALAFYQDALGFRIAAATAEPPHSTGWSADRKLPRHRARLALGAQQIELTEYPDAAPYPADSTSCDLWFQHVAIVVSDMDAAYEQVMRHGATPITRNGPQTLPPSTGSVTAWKFRDPDGHPLELIRFPPGTGDPVWQAKAANGLTLGIDHSAISVGDLERSIAFYEVLGWHVATRGVNRGLEQQRLDDLPDVEVDVVAMQGAAPTPHLELLAYRQPRGRARAPAASPFTTIAADRLGLSAQNLHTVLRSIQTADVARTASRILEKHETVALLEDPDGHGIVLQETD